MYEYHDQYKRAHERGDVEAQTRWTNQLRWEIARHAVGEEIVVYPLMEKHLGEKGKQLADHDRAEHTVSPATCTFASPMAFICLIGCQETAVPTRRSRARHCGFRRAS